MHRLPSILLAVFLVACHSTPRGGESEPVRPRAEAPRDPEPGAAQEANSPRPLDPELEPWTDAFSKKCVLLARDIVVEGPPGMLVHSALTSDATRYVVKNKTTERGFEQLAVARPDVGREVRCQLDQWVLAAENSVLVIERPGPCPVRVIATGAAVWRDMDGNEQRDETLEFLGEKP
ncbi:MAG: hypothetical protein H6830_01540 [Planctomycetes bacterium]|nr:hypothetical protein [Planctomycetota bacterium]MCB9910325.1 hypothetical protein [Planctomycetota bacterium]MCB9912064.1 hypothetical protein [Planctomycetota bacterium]HPF14700.1 hypothetical protein [Planctomycetota bacterium]HRV82220.1 hypothetical protein [Planctomycetota bacterium]